MLIYLQLIIWSISFGNFVLALCRAPVLHAPERSLSKRERSVPLNPLHWCEQASTVRKVRTRSLVRSLARSLARAARWDERWETITQPSQSWRIAHRTERQSPAFEAEVAVRCLLAVCSEARLAVSFRASLRLVLCFGRTAPDRAFFGEGWLHTARWCTWH